MSAARGTDPVAHSGLNPWIACFAALSAAAALLSLFSRRLFHGNFGVVDPGRVYRCSRRWSDLIAFIKAHHVASILNLGHPQDHYTWDINQMRAAHRLGIDLNEVELRYDRRPSRESLFAILDVFDSCRYPLLIHCTDGADRTGLASALYLLAVRDVPPERACREAFSLRYGHVPVCGIGRLHEPIREYRGWLHARGRTHASSRFRSWLERDYRSTPQTFDNGSPATERPGVDRRLPVQ